jgi:AAA15 family ATPase/GTPase
MTLNTIDVFLNKESNPNNAQLIFATHDTNLLSLAKLRRDQIYFAKKTNGKVPKYIRFPILFILKKKTESLNPKKKDPIPIKRNAILKADMAQYPY